MVKLKGDSQTSWVRITIIHLSETPSPSTYYIVISYLHSFDWGGKSLISRVPYKMLIDVFVIVNGSFFSKITFLFIGISNSTFRTEEYAKWLTPPDHQMNHVDERRHSFASKYDIIRKLSKDLPFCVTQYLGKRIWLNFFISQENLTWKC